MKALPSSDFGGLRIERTKQLHPLSTEDSQHLFLSVHKPHAPEKAATIGHWLQKLMAQAGIDISIFLAHSTRGATSKAKNIDVSTSDILKTGRLEFGIYV